MKRFSLILTFLTISLLAFPREYKVYGPQGGLAMEGIASISFDFGGHWKSEGQMQQMTVGKEIKDACKGGREYILTTQELDIYGTAKAYTGPVRLIHGNKDTIDLHSGGRTDSGRGRKPHDHPQTQ